MTLQNRVTPFGEIVAVADRGLLMGNRGIIHDPATRSLLRRRWTTRRWLICVCEFKGRRRQVMAPSRYTELFFLDEATALAAGHRPCFECRRAAAESFRQAWAAARAVPPPGADDMDAVLHGERLDGRAKRLHPVSGPAGELPDGAMLAAAGAAYLVAHGEFWRWSPAGYESVARLPARPELLTPPTTLAVLRAGYRALLHPSAAL